MKPVIFVWNVITKFFIFVWNIIRNRLSFLWKKRKTSSFLKVVSAFFFFLVFFSFLASFSGALIFFTEAPHDEPLKPIKLFCPKPEKNYYIEPTVANPFFSAGLPAEFKNKLSDLTIPRSKSEFEFAVSELLENNKLALSIAFFVWVRYRATIQSCPYKRCTSLKREMLYTFINSNT